MSRYRGRWGVDGCRIKGPWPTVDQARAWLNTVGPMCWACDHVLEMEQPDGTWVRLNPDTIVAPQSTPRDTGGVEVLPLVIADLEARAREGVEHYGQPLRTHNGRRSAQDAYEETLDLAMYWRQHLEELLDADAALADAERHLADYTHHAGVVDALGCVRWVRAMLRGEAVGSERSSRSDGNDHDQMLPVEIKINQMASGPGQKWPTDPAIAQRLELADQSIALAHEDLDHIDIPRHLPGAAVPMRLESRVQFLADRYTELRVAFKEEIRRADDAERKRDAVLAAEAQANRLAVEMERRCKEATERLIPRGEWRPGPPPMSTISTWWRVRVDEGGWPVIELVRCWDGMVFRTGKPPNDLRCNRSNITHHWSEPIVLDPTTGAP